MTNPIAKRLLSNSGWLFGADGISLGLRLASGFALAHFLGVRAFGQLSLVIAFVTLMMQVIEFRAWETAVRFVIRFVEAREHDKARAIVKLCYTLDLGSAAISLGVVMLVAPLGARLFIDDPNATSLIRWFALSIPFTLPAITSSALLRAADMFRALAIKNLAMALVRATALIGAAASGASIEALLLLQVALAALDLVIAVVLSNLATTKLEIRRWWRVSFASLREERKQLVRFVGFTNLAALLKVLQSHLDVLLVGYFLPSTSAGYVQLARWITDAMRFLAGPVNTAAYPEYSRLWDKRDATEIRRVTRSLFAFTTVVAAGALAMVFVCAAPAIRHLAGAEYAPAIPVVYWLAIGTAIEIPTAILHPMLVASERIAWSMIALAFAIVVRIGVLVALIGTQAELAAGVAHLSYAIAYSLFAGFATLRAVSELRTR